MSHKRKLPVCPNCSYNFNHAENFCPSCGQENHELKIPLGHLIYEGIENVFHFDTKFFKTIKLLLFSPGALSKDFNEGKRARYVPPFRLYIFISFIFFFLLSVFIHPSDEALFPKGKLKVIKPDNLPSGVIGVFTLEEAQEAAKWNNEKLDSALIKKGREASWINRYKVRQLAKLQKISMKDLFKKAVKNTSILMFLLMPFFAFILKMFYYRKRKYYYEQLIFSLHFHSFLFLFLTFLLLFSNFLPVPEFVSFLILLIYLIISLKKFFDQKWGKTVFKGILLSITYLVFLGVFLVISLSASVLL